MAATRFEMLLKGKVYLLPAVGLKGGCAKLARVVIFVGM
jgi:hypothetical protein